MKKLLVLLILAFTGVQIFAQAPFTVNYQGVARNNFGTVISNKQIALRLSVRDGAAGGPVVFSERHTINTDQYGVFAVVVGNGTAISGTMAGVNWATGTKFLQAELDPNGGNSFINMGTNQLQSVPFSIIAGGAPPIGPAGGDLAGSTYPNPIIAPLVVTTGKIADGAVTSQKITVPFVKTQAEAVALIDMTNTATGPAISGTNTGTGRGGFFQVLNAASTADALRAETNGTGASWGIHAVSSGTNGAGLFRQTNATNTANNVQSNQAGLGRAGLFNITNTASTANALEANNAGTGVAVMGIKTATTGTIPAVSGTSASTSGNAVAVQGEITSTTPGGFSAAVRGINNGTGGLGIGVWGSQAGSGWGVYGTANGGIGVNGSANSGIGVNGTSNTGTGGRFTTTSGLAIHTTGGVRLEGIGEAANRVLLTDAAGNATWQPVSASGAVTGSGTVDQIAKFTPSGAILGNSLLTDNGTAVGLGTTTPSHRFDVTHSGSTGVGVNSTSGFSVVDINAASGDAALRFANAGVNQWNIRNQPGTDNLQIFELGGGGERMHIQNATGNVSIGGEPSPSYRLDVLHGGSTGARIRSSSSFSVVDIDAQSGDAALRFVKAGVNQWNLRNRPGDDYFEIFELGGGGSRMVIQDGTGNVGIGATAAPTYKLDVLHGGSTGLRVQSSSSFSVVDIDAQSGDAALRFVKAGVNQWNTRNRPADDYYEIFELGGGGSRFVIQDGTGNVGIGQTASPTYKLDVLHGGSTGARVQSSASFSVVDIDANSGDAALRYVKAGVNQWNVRNNPGTDDYQIFELGGGGERMRIENTTGRIVTGGDLHVSGTLSKAAGAFKIDHPMDPENKYLVHSFVESPDMMNIYNGNITTDASGKAIVQLPDYFNNLNKDFRYQLTVIGSFAQAIVSKEVNGNSFEIATSQPNVKVSWQVTGVRQDPWANKYRLQNVVEKSAKDKGFYLNPDIYGKPDSKRIGYTPEPAEESSLNYNPSAPLKPATQDVSGSVSDEKPAAPAKAKAVIPGGSVSDEKPAVQEKSKKAATEKSKEKGSTD